MDISVLYKCFTECGAVTTDSRNCPPGSLFVALRGETFNGNDFVRRALDRGCRCAVTDDKALAAAGDPRILWADDCLKALQELANLHRRRLGTPIIGITGTNGKTTTKELTAAVLQKRYKVLYTEGNLNNHIGVPLTLLRLTPEHELAVIEMGANHPGEIRELARIAEPDYGIITNVGKAHLEGFGSFEGVVKTKGELYDRLRTDGKHIVFIDADNEHLVRISHGLTRVAYGLIRDASAANGAGENIGEHAGENGANGAKNAGANDAKHGGANGAKHGAGDIGQLFVGGRLRSCSPFLSFEWEQDGRRHEADTRLIGAYNLQNALAAVAAGRFFDVPADKICEALAEYTPRNNRSQLTETADNRLIVDAYNANPTSMKAALENFRLIGADRKMVVLGDMKELGEASPEEHRKVAARLHECKFDRVILVGEEFGRATSSFEHYPDAEALRKELEAHKPKGYYILIKGSNSMRLSGLREVL